MKRLAASFLCLLVLAATPTAALGQSAGDDQYADPFAGEEQPQSTPGSSQGNGDRIAGQTGSGAGSPAASSPPAAQTAATPTTSGSSSSLPRTGFPAGFVALLGAFALAGGLMLRAIASRRPASRRDAVLVLGRDLRLEPRARHR